MATAGKRVAEGAIPCDHCGSSESELLFTSFGYPIVRCGRCALMYVGAPPSADTVAERYREDEHWGGEPQRSTEARSRLMYRQVLRLLPARAQVLDVGCSFGGFLRELRGAGHDASGVELSAPGAESARAAGFTVHQKPLADLALPSGIFDAITMLNVVEHFATPVAACREAFRLLRPGGLLVLVTPNTSFALPLVRSYLALTRRGSVDSPLLQKVSQLRAPNHLYFYTPPTLSRLAREAGFEECRIRNAAPILNRSLLRRGAKFSVWLGAESVRALSGGRWVAGHSMLAVARKAG